MRRPILALDLDGTVAMYTKFRGVTHIDKPIQKTVNVLRRLKTQQWIIRVYTCRNNLQFEDVDDPAAVLLALQRWRVDHRVPFDDIVLRSEGKPFADVYLDDRAAGYDPNWTEEQLYDAIIQAFNRGKTQESTLGEASLR